MVAVMVHVIVETGQLISAANLPHCWSPLHLPPLQCLFRMGWLEDKRTPLSSKLPTHHIVSRVATAS
jgi:hypothetical protein